MLKPGSRLNDVYDIFEKDKLRKLVGAGEGPGPRRKTGVTFITDGVQVHVCVLRDFHNVRHVLTNLHHGDHRLELDPQVEVVGLDPGRRDIVTTSNTSVPVESPLRYFRWVAAHIPSTLRPAPLRPAPLRPTPWTLLMQTALQHVDLCMA